MDAKQILEKFLNYANYDPDRNSHNIFSTTFAFHLAIEKIKKFLAYDPSGMFAVLYAKQTFIRVLNNCQLNAFSVVSNPNALHEERDMWSTFTSEDVTALEENILNAFSRLLDQVQSVQKKIGERDADAERNALLECVEAIVEELPNCNEDLFLRGGMFNPITNFSTHIHIFSWLAECLMALEKAEDGMYLCYVRNCDTPKPEDADGKDEAKGLASTADGYFGFYIKSNGNILSVNERVNESYPGEHNHHRNARYSDEKKYKLFPYSSIFSFSNYDYKGVARTHTIDDQKLAFLELDPRAYIPLVAAMIMLNAKYAGTSPNEMPIKYVDSLLDVNLALPTPGMTDIMVVGDSAIATVNREFTVNMTADDIRTGKFVRNYSELGEFPKFQNIFVDLYGDGFTLNPASLLESNTHLKRIGSGPVIQKRNLVGTVIDATPHPEFVGIPQKFETIAYKNGRAALAEYIRDKMLEEYKAFGGAKAVKDWYRDAVAKNLPNIIQLCIERYNRPAEWNRQDEDREHALHILFDRDQKYPSSYSSRLGAGYMWFNECNMHWGTGRPNPSKGFKCCVNTDTNASIFFTFDIRDWGEICRVTGVGADEVPKILRGYHRDGHREYGNSILRPTDACSGIGTPFEKDECRINQRYWSKKDWEKYFWDNGYFRDCEHLIPKDLITDYPAEVHFHFSIGFSKRGWKKVLAGEVPRIGIEDLHNFEF